jgi:hypothetical protein
MALIFLCILYLSIMLISICMKPDRRRRRVRNSEYSDDYTSVSQSYFDYDDEMYTNSRYAMSTNRNSLFDKRLEQNMSIGTGEFGGDSDSSSIQNHHLE